MDEENLTITDVSESSPKHKQQKQNLKKAIITFLVAATIAIGTSTAVNVLNNQNSNEVSNGGNTDYNSVSVDAVIDNEKENEKNMVHRVVGYDNNGKEIVQYFAWNEEEALGTIWQKESRTQNSLTGEYSNWNTTLELSIGNDVPVDSDTERYIYLGLISNDAEVLPLFQQEVREKNLETGSYSEWETTNHFLPYSTELVDSELERYRFAGNIKINGENFFYQTETRDFNSETGQYGEWKSGLLIINPDNVLQDSDTTRYVASTGLELNFQNESTIGKGK